MIKTQCYSCHKPLELYDKVSREERCPHCNADLHVCLNCLFYDPSAYNECHEPVADRVVDKDRSNFCDFFKLQKDPGVRQQAVDKAAEARRKLEELFQKKS